jgi:hypothetical protein
MQLQLHHRPLHCSNGAFPTPVANPARGSCALDAHAPFLSSAVRRAAELLHAELPPLLIAQLCVQHVAQLFWQDVAQRRVRGADLARRAFSRNLVVENNTGTARAVCYYSPNTNGLSAPSSTRSFRLATLHARHLTSSSATGRPEGYRGNHRSLALLQHRRLRQTNHQGDTRAAHRAAARVEALPLVSCPPATTGRV